jgi:toxin ParE1/3/4
VKVVWTPEAEQDRADVLDYVAADNPQAAVRMDELFSETADRLGNFPMLGHIGRVLGTRELIPHESYRLVYVRQPARKYIDLHLQTQGD